MSGYAASLIVDQKASEFVHSYVQSCPKDGVVHPLNERDFGYFTVADDPIGSDRAVRTIQLRNKSDGDDLYYGGNGNDGLAGAVLAPGESVTLAVAFLSNVGVKVLAGAANAVDVEIVLVCRGL